MNWYIIYHELKIYASGKPELRHYEVRTGYLSFHHAYAVACIEYDLHTPVKKKGGYILSDNHWNANIFRYAFVFCSAKQLRTFTFRSEDRYSRSFKKRIESMISEHKESEKRQHIGMKADPWIWYKLNTLPEGFRFLKKGETILEDDIEFDDYSYPGVRTGSRWGSVSHYNKGQTVKKDYGMCIILKNGSKVYRKRLIRPVIARKIT